MPDVMTKNYLVTRGLVWYTNTEGSPQSVRFLWVVLNTEQGSGTREADPPGRLVW